jgi:hypothetical protein
MQDLYSKCGANCGRCPSFRDNLQTDQDRRRVSKGWHKYLGFRLSPAKLRQCDGCQAPDDENPIRYQSCYVRKCAVANGVETCAHCSAYPCADVPKVSLPADYRDRVAARLGASIPDEAYVAFIEPYEGTEHLDRIHASLRPKDIVEMTRVSVRPRIVDLPADMPLAGKDTSALAALHRLLATIEVVDGISYARQTVLKKRRRDLLKMLWAFGLRGEPEGEGNPRLVLDAETYSAQGIHSGYSRVMDYSRALEEYGVCCELVPLTKEGWLTPGKALRKKGWVIKMCLGDEAGGASALTALQYYAAALHQEYGKQAFTRFSQADMRLLRKRRQSDGC